ncbi:MAG: bacteriohemerythrin [Leptolyngbya sp.]|nr:bacteriohemerythrin [Leptolyngbya sp.]
MVIAAWRDEYCTGHAVIDAQHRHLFDLVNRVHWLLSNGPGEGNGETWDLLREFAQCAQEHFALEEQLMADYDYPHVEMHCKTHQRLVDKVARVLDPDTAVDLTPEAVTQVLADWMVHHIKGEDQRMIRYFQAQETFQAQPSLV